VEWVGSNSRPADYEMYGPAQHALAAQMTRIIALTALAVLGLSDAPVHEPVHAEAPLVRSSYYCA